MARVKKMVSELLKTGFISIDSYEDKCFNGHVHYPAFESETKFSNAMQMLGAIEKAVDELGYTDSYCEMRSFVPMAESPLSGEKAAAQNHPPRGALATFKVKIIFMQNATWQGTIFWEESGEEQNFRSVLEMLKLMDSALESVGE